MRKFNYLSGGTVLEISTSTRVLTPADVSVPTFYNFKPYKTSDYPAITIDTDYFAFYSADHASGSDNYGIWLGKFNNLDLSDFVEVGQVYSEAGEQVETPWFYYFPDNDEPYHLYAHTTRDEANIDAGQHTILLTTTGGDLVNSDWTLHDNPLGNQSNDQHTGYLRLFDFDGELIATHNKRGINEGNGYIGEQQRSHTHNGISFVRGELLDTTSLLPSNRMFLYTFGTYFKKYNRWWWIGVTREKPLTGNQVGWGAQLLLCRADSDATLTSVVKILNNEKYLLTWEVYIEGDTMHLYHNFYSNGIDYATLDLTLLQKFV